MQHATTHDCYLVCAAADVQAGLALRQVLVARGWRVWFADTDLQPGEFRDDVLPIAQRSSRLTVAMLSPGSSDDYELRTSIAEGVALGRRPETGHRVLPVLFGGVRLPFIPFVGPQALVEADRLGSWVEVARALDALDDGRPRAAGPEGLLVDALLKGAVRRMVPIDPDLVADAARAINGEGDGEARARAAGAVFGQALEHHPPTAVRLLRTLAEGPELAAGTPFGALDGDALREACLAVWRRHPIDDADCWANWAAWAARDPAVLDGLGVDPVEEARRCLALGDTAWCATWRRLWALHPGHGGLVRDATVWLDARRRPPDSWVAVWEELLAGLGRIGDRAVLLLLGARWLRGRQALDGWPVVWRTLLADPAGLPIGVRRAQLLQVGLDWLGGATSRPGWVDVWSTLLAEADAGGHGLDRRALLAQGRGALDASLRPAAWARLLKALMRAAGVPHEELFDLGTDWLLRNEAAPAWAVVWQTLLDACDPEDSERHRLLDWGRGWIVDHGEAPTWPLVMERLIDAGLRDPEVLERAEAWLSGPVERPVLAARLLTVATARVPCDTLADALARWLAEHADDRRAEQVGGLLAAIGWDGIDRRGWGPGWTALTARGDDREAAEARAWDGLARAAASGETLRGTVVEVVKGGLSLDLGVPAFMPASQIDRGVIHDRGPYLDQTLFCRVIRLDRAARRVVVSRVAVLDARRAELLATLAVGDWVDGHVKRLEKFGAFVDLGGLDGLVHVTEIGFGHVRHPRDRLQTGQRVRVRVLEVDRARERVSLSLKDPARDPWLHVPARYRPGVWLEGRVAHLTHYGAFVELEQGVEGMVHVSEMSWARDPDPPATRTRSGAQVKVRVVSVDLARRRLTLSMLDPQSDPWRRFARLHPVGSTVRGRVEEVRDGVARVALDGPLTAELSSLAHDVRPGQTLEARVKAVEPAERSIVLTTG